MSTDRVALVFVAALLLTGCPWLNEKPPEAPPKPQAAALPSEPAPLPPEEIPPPEPEPAQEAAVPPKPVEPGIAPTGAPTRGTLPKDVIDQKLAEAGPALRACYEQRLKVKPSLAGDVSIDFVVMPDGKIGHVAASEVEGALEDEPAISCMLNEIKKLEFPKPRGGRVFINYPLKLEPPK
jgi:hypothetical protein